MLDIAHPLHVYGYIEPCLIKDMAEEKNGIPYYLGLSHHDFNLFFC